MDKVIINNQIVSMRKFVKQAKIRAINKYTKEIRLLQNRKGNDDETAKHKRKAERLLSKVAILRKIQPDAISRKALSKEKEWKDVLKEKNIPLEDQCHAMLANYGPVQSEVEKFHKKHWDVVPKIEALFKSWEEKSKNPMLKQERKKAKELKKSLKAANVKLGKDNPNAAPIGPIIKDNLETEPPLSIEEKEKNGDVTQKLSDDMNEDLNSKLIKNDTTSLSLLNVSIDEEDSDEENEKIKESKNNVKKSPIKKWLKNESKVEKKKMANKVELEESKSILKKSPIKKWLKNESKVLKKNTANKVKLEDSQLKQIADLEENDSESEADSLDNDSEDDSEEEENKKIEESKNILKKSPITKWLKNESIVEKKKTANKVELEESQLKQIADLEENDSENEADSLDNDSEDDSEEEENISEGHESDIESETEETIEDTEEPMKVNKVGSNEMKQKPNLKSPKPGNINAKLKAIADASQKRNTFEKRKSSFMKNVNPPKKPEVNNLKAVTMLNLNELEGLEEFNVEKTDASTEETGEKKRRRDPFFLGKEGEVVSESDKEDSDNPDQERDGQDFKRKKFNNFERKSNDRQDFKQRKFNNFERKSSDGQDFKQRKFNNFERKSSDGQDFKQRKFNNFDRKSSDGDFFRKRNFNGDAPQNRRSGFKDNGFQRNKRDANFEDKDNSFQNRGRPSHDKGFKSMSKDQFKGKRENKSFHDRPSTGKPNFRQESSNKPRFQKNKPSSPLKKNSVDDKPLHPSWEAKKKLKESAKTKFQGKRIVFGD